MKDIKDALLYLDSFDEKKTCSIPNTILNYFMYQK